MRSTSSSCQIGANRAGEVYTVQVDADAGIQVEGEVVLADAAYRCRQHRAVAGERRTRIQVDARGQIAERVDVGQIAALSALRLVNAVMAIGTFWMFSLASLAR